eukprot:g11033.t1
MPGGAAERAEQGGRRIALVRELLYGQFDPSASISLEDFMLRKEQLFDELGGQISTEELRTCVLGFCLPPECAPAVDCLGHGTNAAAAERFPSDEDHGTLREKLDAPSKQEKSPSVGSCELSSSAADVIGSSARADSQAIATSGAAAGVGPDLSRTSTVSVKMQTGGALEKVLEGGLEAVPMLIEGGDHEDFWLNDVEVDFEALLDGGNAAAMNAASDQQHQLEAGAEDNLFKTSSDEEKLKSKTSSASRGEAVDIYDEVLNSYDPVLPSNSTASTGRGLQVGNSSLTSLCGLDEKKPSPPTSKILSSSLSTDGFPEGRSLSVVPERPGASTSAASEPGGPSATASSGDSDRRLAAEEIVQDATVLTELLHDQKKRESGGAQQQQQAPQHQGLTSPSTDPAGGVPAALLAMGRCDEQTRARTAAVAVELARKGKKGQALALAMAAKGRKGAAVALTLALKGRKGEALALASALNRAQHTGKSSPITAGAAVIPGGGGGSNGSSSSAAGANPGKGGSIAADTSSSSSAKTRPGLFSSEGAGSRLAVGGARAAGPDVGSAVASPAASNATVKSSEEAPGAAVAPPVTAASPQQQLQDIIAAAAAPAPSRPPAASQAGTPVIATANSAAGVAAGFLNSHLEPSCGAVAPARTGVRAGAAPSAMPPAGGAATGAQQQVQLQAARRQQQLQLQAAAAARQQMSAYMMNMNLLMQRSYNMVGGPAPYMMQGAPAVQGAATAVNMQQNAAGGNQLGGGGSGAAASTNIYKMANARGKVLRSPVCLLARVFEFVVMIFLLDQTPRFEGYGCRMMTYSCWGVAASLAFHLMFFLFPWRGNLKYIRAVFLIYRPWMCFSLLAGAFGGAVSTYYCFFSSCVVLRNICLWGGLIICGLYALAWFRGETGQCDLYQ